jgi:hypothetical protein
MRMLDKVTVSKRKEKTVVARVNEQLKVYLDDSAKRLGVSSSAYLLQLIENDRNPNVFTIILDDNTMKALVKRNEFYGDTNLDETFIKLIRKGLLNED